MNLNNRTVITHGDNPTSTNSQKYVMSDSVLFWKIRTHTGIVPAAFIAKHGLS